MVLTPRRYCRTSQKTPTLTLTDFYLTTRAYDQDSPRPQGTNPLRYASVGWRTRPLRLWLIEDQNLTIVSVWLRTRPESVGPATLLLTFHFQPRTCCPSITYYIHLDPYLYTNTQPRRKQASTCRVTLTLLIWLLVKSDIVFFCLPYVPGTLWKDRQIGRHYPNMLS